MFRILTFLAWFAVHIAGAETQQARISELVKKFRDCIVLVEFPGGAGSAFVAKFGNGTYLMTNQHVVAGSAEVKFKRVDLRELKTLSVAAAVGHDIMAYTLDPSVPGIEIMAGVEQFVAPGDDVVVLGNPDGAGVIHPLAGKISGLGPQLVEVTAEFVAGNSGSAIVHLKTGKVIAIATYISVEKKEPGTPIEGTRVRRFGFRFDSIRQWQVVRPWEFYDEYQTLEKVRQRTRDLQETIQAIFLSKENKEPSDPALFPDKQIAQAVRKYQTAARKDPKSAEIAAKILRADLVNACASDTDLASRRIGYDHFERDLAREVEKRRRLSEILAGSADP